MIKKNNLFEYVLNEEHLIDCLGFRKDETIISVSIDYNYKGVGDKRIIIITK